MVNLCVKSLETLVSSFWILQPETVYLQRLTLFPVLYLIRPVSIIMLRFQVVMVVLETPT